MSFRKINNKIYVFLFGLVFCSNIYGEIICDNENYDRYANMILYKSGQEIGKNLGITCIGSGGSMPYGVEKLSLFFESNKSVNIDQARKMEIQAVEKFLSIINADEKIRPFLKEYPFPATRVFLMIAFLGKANEPNSVDAVYHSKNLVYYDKRSNSNNKLETFYNENYNDSLKAVNFHK